MNITASQIQYTANKACIAFPDIVLQSGGNTADGIFGSQVQDLFVVNPVVPVNESLNYILPSNFAASQDFVFDIACVLSVRAIVTGTGASGTYAGPFAVPVKLESFGNLRDAVAPTIKINGGTPIAQSFTQLNNVAKLQSDVQFVTIGRSISAKVAMSMDSLIQNAYFIPDVSAGDWFLDAYFSLSVIAHGNN